MTATITLEQLRRRGACSGQMEKFQKYFGQEVAVTLRGLMPYAYRMSFYWGIFNLLSEEGKRRALKQTDKAYTVYSQSPGKIADWRRFLRARAAAFIRQYKAENS